MLTTFEAIIDEQGNVKIYEKINLPAKKRALVIILEEEPPITPIETALLSEEAFATDWTRKEEDEAWSHLQSKMSS